MQRLLRGLLAVLLILVLLGVARLGEQTAPPAERMALAASKLLNSLEPEQRKRLTFTFDDPERFGWHFVPLQDRMRQPTRKGLPLGAMNAEQKVAALALVQAGLSATGYERATTIISLETILKELEGDRGPVRDPGWYFVCIFGEPSARGTWGWRIDGHHLALNFTMKDGQVLSATPTFFGANPATVKAGPRQGTRPLAELEELARQLFQGLDESSKNIARQEKQFPEVAGRTKAAQASKPIGLTYAAMKPEHQALLKKLVLTYLNNLAPEIAAAERKRLETAGWEQIHFACCGSFVSGEPTTYRIQGPTFRVEFLNVQSDSAGNKANHIHTCWRSLPVDFGLEKP
jgi:hypothetical protein